MYARIRKAVHNTGCLPIEAVVRYPFHPFAGQLVPIVGHIEHAGTRHLIIRTADKSGFLLPSWMTAPEAGAIQIVAGPRLPLNRIIELRALVDRLMASSSGELVPTGGQRHEKNVTAAKSVRKIRLRVSTEAAGWFQSAGKSSASASNIVRSSSLTALGC